MTDIDIPKVPAGVAARKELRLTSQEAADYLGCSLQTFRVNWRRWGLKPSRFGRFQLFPLTQLEQLADK